MAKSSLSLADKPGSMFNLADVVWKSQNVIEGCWITVIYLSRRFSPLCVSCNEPIIPAPGSEETVRVVALDKNFHLKCYRCEVRYHKTML